MSEVRGLDPGGYTHPIHPFPGYCMEPSCGSPAPAWVVDLREMRRGKVACCYCPEHGGRDRAIRELEKDARVLAPPGVGDLEAVALAGTLGLDSTHRYVVVRPEAGQWLAFLGLGSYMVQVQNPLGGRLDKLGRKVLRGNGDKRAWAGLCTFEWQDLAVQRGVEAWRARLELRMAEIKLARGGNLAWGFPVRPAAEPIVIVLKEGQNAWDEAPSLTAE